MDVALKPEDIKKSYIPFVHRTTFREKLHFIFENIVF